jgi:hypothetical protein
MTTVTFLAGMLSDNADASLDYQQNLVAILCKKAIRSCA